MSLHRSQISEDLCNYLSVFVRLATIWLRLRHVVSDADYWGLSTLRAARAAAVRVSTPILANRLLACFFTVLMDESRMIAISGLVFPSLIQYKTSASRAVRPSASNAFGPLPPLRCSIRISERFPEVESAKWSISISPRLRWVTLRGFWLPGPESQVCSSSGR